MSEEIIGQGWEQYRERADAAQKASQHDLRLLKSGFYSGFIQAFKVLSATGICLDEQLFERIAREVDEYCRSGE